MSPISEPPVTTDVDTVVVGAGQAGLAVGQQLRSRGLDFVLLDASDEPGSSWRSRWDSLRLFTPAAFSRLPGMPWEDPAASPPTKDAMADYLQAYAQRFALPIQHGTRIGAVRHGTRGSELEVEAEDGRCWTARNVVLATGAHARARVPDLAQCLGDQVEQVQSLRYQRPSQLSDGRVVVVGAGNSGAEIALDIVAGAAGPATSSTQMREVVLAGPDLGHLPRLGSWTYPLMQGLGRAGVALADRGSRGAGDPLGRVRPGELEAAGVRRVPRVVGARDDRLHLEDGSSLTAATVVWCTGLVPDHRLVRLPTALDPEGRVLHRRGVTPVAGLYVIGMPRQTSLTSHLVGGVGHDAELIVDHLRRR